MGNSIGTLAVIWSIAVFLGLCGAAVWIGFRKVPKHKPFGDDSTYGGAIEGDDQHFRK